METYESQYIPNESIKTFDDVCHHIELDDDRMETTKSSEHSYVTKFSSCKDACFKLKKGLRPSKKGKKVI